MPVFFEAAGPEGEAVKGSLDYTMQNMNMRASGDPSKVIYDYTADQIGIVLNELAVEGETMPEGALNVSFTSQNLSGQSVMEPGALRKIAQNMALGATTYAVTFKDPSSDDGVNFNGEMASLSFSVDSFLPASMDPEERRKRTG